MNRWTPLALAMGLFTLSYLLSSYSSNPPNGYTGAPGDGLCTNCHQPSNPNFQGNITITGLPANITAGQTYPITVTVAYTMGSPVRAGFQMVVLDQNNQNAGTLSNPGPSSTVTPTGSGRVYFEHSPAVNFGGNTSVSWTVDWTAPNGPSGAVITMYAAGNIANGSGTANDRIITTSVSGTLQGGGTPLSVSIVSQTNVSCFGGADGSLTAAASGGTPPYSYTWSNGMTGATITNLPAGTYTVTATDNAGATATVSATITQPTPLVVSIVSQTDATCASPVGSATAAASGGTPGYTYVWSIGTTGPVAAMPPGTYQVTVTDAQGCMASTSVTIGFNTTPPVAVASANGQLDCNHPIITLSGSGSSTGAQYTYQWSGPGIVSGANTLNPVVDQPGTYTLTVTNTDNGCTASDSVSVNEVPGLQIDSVAATPVSCTGGADGTASVVSVSGGTPPYSYFWPATGDSTQSIQNLTAGSYWVWVFDANGCKDSATVHVTEPLPLMITIATTDETAVGASDGTASATVSGGTPPYSYVWSTGATDTTMIDGLAPGTYCLTVTDANGCSASVCGTVHPWDCSQFALTFQLTEPLCADSANGSITAIPQNASMPVQYQWSTGAQTATLSDIPAGTYSVTATDAAGCTTADTITLTAPVPIFTLVEIEPVECHGDSTGAIFLVTGGGTAPYTWTWSTGDTTPNIEQIPAGYYAVIIEDAHGCQGVDTIFVPAPPLLVVNVHTTPVSNATASDGTAWFTASGGTPPYTWQWSTGSTDSMLVGLPPGEYCLTLTDALGCTATTCDSIPVFDCSQLAISLEGYLISCNGDTTVGQVQAMVSGGTAPYTFSWSDGSTGQINPINQAGLHSVTVTDANNCTAIDSIVVTAQTATIELSATADPESCTCAGDGSIALNVSGTYPPFEIAWCDGQTGPVATNLSTCTTPTLCVEVIDSAGCQVFANYPLPPPQDDIPPVAVAQDVTLFLDAAGQATLDAGQVDAGSSDNCTLDSMWLSQTAFDCSHVGQRTVVLTVMDGSGLTAKDTAQVTIIDAIAPQIQCPQSIVLTSCDSVVVDYPWPTATDNCGVDTIIQLHGPPPGTLLAPGFYNPTFLAKDESGNALGCDFVIDILPGAVVEVTASAQMPSCAGAADGAISLDISGGTPPYDISWDDPAMQIGPQATNLVAGTYTATITDAIGCQATVSIELTEPEPLLIDATVYPDTAGGIHTGQIVAMIGGGTPPYTFEWTANGQPFDSTSLTLTNLAAGEYCLSVLDAHGCADTACFVVDVLDALIEPTNLAHLHVRPVPADAFIEIQVGWRTPASGRVEVFGLEGQALGGQDFAKAAEWHARFDTRAWPAGVYLVQIRTNQGGLLWRRFVVQH